MVTAIFFQIIESLLVEFSLGRSFLGGTMFLNYFLSKSCYMIMYDQCKLRRNELCHFAVCSFSIFWFLCIDNLLATQLVSWDIRSPYQGYPLYRKPLRKNIHKYLYWALNKSAGLPYVTVILLSFVISAYIS